MSSIMLHTEDCNYIKQNPFTFTIYIEGYCVAREKDDSELYEQNNVLCALKDKDIRLKD